MRIRLHHWIKRFWLLLLMMVLFSYAMFQGGFVSWFLVYSLFPFCIYTFILSFYSAKKWDVRASFSKETVQAGGKVDVILRFKRKSRFPIPFLALEHNVSNSMRFYDEGLKKYENLEKNLSPSERTIKHIIYPWMKKEFSIRYELDKLPRGEHYLESLTFFYGDPFGFLEKRFEFPIQQKLTVLPTVREMKMRFPATHQEEGVSGILQQDARKTNTVSSVREYVAGDRFSWIDWKTTARKNTMMTKEFEHEKELELTCILDLSGDVSRSQITFEASIDVAVSLLHVLKKKKQQTNFMVYNDPVKIFNHEQVQYQLNGIVHYLATVENKGIPFDYKRVRSIQKSACIWILTHITDKKATEISKMKRFSPNMTIIYIGPEKTIQQNKQLTKLQASGIHVIRMTENVLSKNSWEVDSR
ncbi:uncharacterized protein (DUF58 family) [Gracilibacillus halotolerans]|uniref:Uncharacterized protein (DUF58 family) n=1 Tax=Gracilibacillus halotolerans TaxID=74386 RepID=A0A841RSQ8_9BACI|nr:DUF58 domain-containing protein [Gracilibacillus halotolerans]MBB6514356.1 uncharacterized protein (DUF58 family) [Gracilibacillus halotolerans]